MSEFKLDTPEFATEQEEADWWFNNQNLIAAMFEAKYGPPPSSRFVAADVDGEDADLLRKRAAAAGIEPHIYATRLIHEALHREHAA